MPNDMIRYDLLVQEALCGVVSKVLTDVARNGLPGDHHFYITFRTHAPGVRLSSRMRELYPEEMTIILQHQFEDLKVTDHGFEVGLSFKGIPELLLIPFDAMSGFSDPSVQFSLKFEPQAQPDDASVTSEPARVPTRPQALPTPPAPTSVTLMPSPPTPIAPTATTGAPATGAPVAAKPNAATSRTAKGGSDAPSSSDADRGGEATEEAKVVSIDAFRKKP